MPNIAMVGDGVRGGVAAQEPTVAVPCPRCGRATTWVLRDYGNFRSIGELRVGCDCDLPDDEWTDLASEAGARLAARCGAVA